LKRIDRDPEKFQVMDLFEAISRKRDLKLTDDHSPEKFIEGLSRSFASSKENPAVIHGRRVESMFEHVAASLGKCVLIKREDAGEICASDVQIRLPDFRIILDDGREIFIEIKNCHEADPNHRLPLKSGYFEALKKYAKLFGRELFIGIFWSRWKKWTLIRPEDFSLGDDNLSISFREAIAANQMAVLGDTLIATTPPLTLRLVTDPDKPRRVDDQGNGAFTIGRVDLYCDGTLIEDEFEKQLAFYFMLNSDWVTNEPRAEILSDELMHLEFTAAPKSPVPDQGLQMLGYSSDMMSRHYNDLTVVNGQVERLSPNTDPGTLGVLIPLGYKGRQLPLWRFNVEPKRTSTSIGETTTA
jgi:hypothetical protein